MISEHATKILEFWFGNPQSVDYGKSRSIWFQKDDNFDQLLRDRFLPIYEQAAAGSLESWQEDSQSCLALIISDLASISISPIRKESENNFKAKVFGNISIEVNKFQ
jgi:hypothetical protein